MTETLPHLTLFSAAPALSAENGQLRIDDKFVAGMRLHAAQWGGPVTAVMRDAGQAALPFTSLYAPEELGFNVTLLAPDAPAASALEARPGLVLVSADMTDQLQIGPAAKNMGLSVVYGIEYTLGTRLRIAMIDQNRSLAKRLWSALWNYRQEKKRRRALREADGIQLNGFPAAQDYGALNQYALRYLDNRMRRDMFATAGEMAVRKRYHAAGGPLRLIHSGRLEALKGAHLLIPLAEQLAAQDVPFTFAIYGDGSLAPQIGAQIAAKGLGDKVTLHGPVPFETTLVPVSRQQADLFVSCHVQSDPSCTYIEAMGCGLPVLGFDNQMLSPLVRDSSGGWTVPMNQTRRMAARIAELAADRPAVLATAEAALAYARRHDFESEFAARMEHLKRVFNLTCPIDLTFAAPRG